MIPATSSVDQTPAWTPRERQAVEQLGVTTFSRGVRHALVAVFLVSIVAIPLFETVQEIRETFRTRERMLAEGAPVSALPGRRPRVSRLLEYLPVPPPEELRALEDDLLLKSAAGRLIRPWAQSVLSGFLGVGNASVIIGRDGWLHYVDGVDYVTGRGFLEPEHLARAQEAGRHGDPRPAILQLHRELEALGVALVVVPIPDKAVIIPGSLSRALDGKPALQNRSWPAFVAEMRQAGVRLVDLTEPMSRAEVSGTHQFLHADTHWSPAGIDTAAKATAAFISQTVAVPPTPRVYQRQDVPLQLTEGDLVQLLDLPRSQSTQLGRQAVVMQRVLEPTGSTWQSDPSSGVLLIGDSFSELFSLEGAGPTGAGFAEQISFYLQHPLERRASHAAVEFDTRQGLGRSLAEVRAVAPRYRVVIWEFAVRKLAALDWPLLPEGR